jgi:hypothetical protein
LIIVILIITIVPAIRGFYQREKAKAL